MTESANVNLVVVCGATASGKTRLGVEWARRYGGEILSVDPQQVYSLWNYLGDFDRTFRDISARARLPVAVGGTGLYLEAALRGSEVPERPADEEFRGGVRAASCRRCECLPGATAGAGCQTAGGTACRGHDRRGAGPDGGDRSTSQAPEHLLPWHGTAWHAHALAR
ncbi:MAG TPA: hypothetical protein DIC52_05140 [Candidatus Latescibacteria bacterium]|nr:hypothetical protein [Candidatus Latescibacterota bacterium]